MSFYSFEMVLVGIILFTGMTFAGVRIWQKRKNEAKKDSFTNTNQNIEKHEEDM